MKILIVAPETDLEIEKELFRAATGFRPTFLTGTVTKSHVLNEIRTGNYDIIHFAGHGEEHYVKMSDGPIEQDVLERAIEKAGDVKIVFLNSCSSMHSVAEIYNNTDVSYAIGWPKDVPNEYASFWAVVFYEALSMDHNDVAGAAKTASDAFLKTYKMKSHEIPVVLNGRVMQWKRKYEDLEEEVNDCDYIRLKRFHLWIFLGLMLVVTIMYPVLLSITH